MHDFWSSVVEFASVVVPHYVRPRVAVHMWYNDGIRAYADLTRQLNQRFCDANGYTLVADSVDRIHHSVQGAPLRQVCADSGDDPLLFPKTTHSHPTFLGALLQPRTRRGWFKKQALQRVFQKLKCLLSCSYSIIRRSCRKHRSQLKHTEQPASWVSRYYISTGFGAYY